MPNTSHASSNDDLVTRLYGHSIEKEMEQGSFVKSLLLAWTGDVPRDFEAELLEKCLIASLSNGPGTISAQGAKRITVRRLCDIAFMVFAIGRVAGATEEFLDHQDTGNPLDMRLPVSECTILTRPRD